MRVLILIALLFTFVVGGFSDAVHAAAQDHTCMHHQLDQDDSTENEPCHSEQDQSQCDDCCCIHSHSMAAVNTSARMPLNVTKHTIIALADNPYSVDLSGLRRPPRL